MRENWKPRTRVFCLEYKPKCGWRGLARDCKIEGQEYRCPKCGDIVCYDQMIMIRTFDAHQLDWFIRRFWLTCEKSGFPKEKMNDFLEILGDRK